MRAVEPALDALADEEHRRRGAVIGSEAAVLLHAAAELGEDHHRDLVASPEPIDVLDESADRVGRVHQQSAMQVGLLDVRVEGVPRVGDVVQTAWACRRR